MMNNYDLTKKARKNGQRTTELVMYSWFNIGE